MINGDTCSEQTDFYNDTNIYFLCYSESKAFKYLLLPKFVLLIDSLSSVILKVKLYFKDTKFSFDSYIKPHFFSRNFHC